MRAAIVMVSLHRNNTQTKTLTKIKVENNNTLKLHWAKAEWLISNPPKDALPLVICFSGTQCTYHLMTWAKLLILPPFPPPTSILWDPLILNFKSPFRSIHFSPIYTTVLSAKEQLQVSLTSLQWNLLRNWLLSKGHIMVPTPTHLPQSILLYIKSYPFMKSLFYQAFISLYDCLFSTPSTSIDSIILIHQNHYYIRSLCIWHVLRSF